MREKKLRTGLRLTSARQARTKNRIEQEEDEEEEKDSNYQ